MNFNGNESPSDAEPSGTEAPRSRSVRKISLLLGLLLLGGALASAAVGPVPIPLEDVVGMIAQRLLGTAWVPSACPLPLVVAGRSVPCATMAEILWDSRVPEIILAVLVGVALALAGGTMQGVFRNPLGDPYLLGISSGASLGAAAFFLSNLGGPFAPVELPLFAFLGAVGTAGVILVASHSSRATTEVLLLTGVALGSLFGALISLVLSLRPNGTLLPLTFWILGSLSGATWPQVAISFAAILSGGVLLALHGREINLLQLGDETARGLGCRVDSVRRRTLLLASFITAVAVAFSGAIGFVGLVSPHIMRRLQGPDYRYLLGLGGAFGGLFLLVSDDLAVSLLGSGGILPVGVVTSFVGAPFFLWVLYRRHLGQGM
jgi:iron complex transport system permease protein